MGFRYLYSTFVVCAAKLWTSWIFIFSSSRVKINFGNDANPFQNVFDAGIAYMETGQGVRPLGSGKVRIQ